MKAIIFDFNRTLYDADNKRLFPEVINILESLKSKYMLYLIGKGNEERKDLINSLGIEKYFERIIITEEKSINNFKEILNDLNYNPQEVYVIGDRIKSEIKIGNSFNMNTIWLKKGKFKNEIPLCKEEEPKYTITELTLDNIYKCLNPKKITKIT